MRMELANQSWIKRYVASALRGNLEKYYAVKFWIQMAGFRISDLVEVYVECTREL